MNEDLQAMLSGGHPSWLGRTEEVVDLVLADRSRVADLYERYGGGRDLIREMVMVVVALSAVQRRSQPSPLRPVGVEGTSAA
jgi:hypothetical protein